MRPLRDHTGQSSKTPRPKENVFREAPSTITAVTDREDVVTSGHSSDGKENVATRLH